MQETPIKRLMESKFTMVECITPPKEDQEMDKKSENSSNDLRKSRTPDPLKVPKAFKHPERYRSPTDLIISPITKGLLARNRKGGALLPPSLNQPKAQQCSKHSIWKIMLQHPIFCPTRRNLLELTSTVKSSILTFIHGIGCS
ncbi:unnamed protein product [Dovyalis caffra]|uniref:Uncharacterized protein n=1 Tax=Dovyalis caffra TaxID=77055 RepID=A0AAV1SRF8_9ROSI|nr:unnamed protein product [Dovyalis caffra]